MLITGERGGSYAGLYAESTLISLYRLNRSPDIYLYISVTQCLLQEREEDPMLAYMRKKKAKVVGKVKVLPKYSGPQPPPNR